MSGFKRLVYYWLPALIWMGLIFILSSRPRIVLSPDNTINFIIFKFLHMVEYSILYFLLFRGFNSLSKKNFTFKEKLLFPLLIAIFYAVTDEIHQTFIPTREGRIRDVVIDALGISIMYSFVKVKYDQGS